MPPALEYTQRGWHVFPLRPNDKRPYAGFAWRDLSSKDPARIQEWIEQYPGCNWGVDCGKSGLAVIDIDVKDGKDGLSTALDLRLEGFDLPPTLVIQTPSGGEHHVYRGRIKNSVEKIGSGIDTRGLGGYILLPGSIITGNKYFVQQESRLVGIPDWTVDKVGKASEKAEDRSTPVIGLDQPHNIKEAIHYLSGASPALQGEGGDLHTYQTACKVRDLGISEQVTLTMMLDHWNHRCEPPWDADELAVKVSNAYQYANSPAGAGTLEAVFPPVEIEVVDVLAGVKLPSPITNWTTKPPSRDWILENWLPVGEMTLFSGKYGVGKSLMALQLAGCIASGIPWMGLPIENPMPVMYVSCEDSEVELKRRWWSIAEQPEFAMSDIEYIRSRVWTFDRVDEPNTLAVGVNYEVKKGTFYPILAAVLDMMPKGPKVIMLDTLADMFAGNENERTVVTRYIKEVLGSLRKKYEATIITLAHPPKYDDVAYSGSTGWPASHRNVIWVKPHDNKNLPDHRIIQRAKCNYTWSGEELVVQYQQGAFNRESRTEIHDEIEASNMDRVLEHIRYEISQGRTVTATSQARLRYIGNHRIFNAGGEELIEREKNALVVALVQEGRLEEVRGAGHKNGLWPIKREVLE